MKTKNQILAAAGGSHEAAFDALYTDYASAVGELVTAQGEAEKNAGESIRARVIAAAVEPLAEVLGITLPPKGQRPAKDAQATLEAEVESALSGIQGQEEAADAFLDTVIERIGIDPEAFHGAFKDLPEQPTAEQFTAALDAALEPVRAPQARLQQQERELAASRLGLSLEDLSDVLGERQPTRQTVQRDGQDAEVFGVGEGDSFKPLDEMRAVQALRGEHKPEPQRQQFPAQATGGGKPKAPDAVDALNSRLFGGRNASKEQ